MCTPPPNASRSCFLISPTLAWCSCPKTHLPSQRSCHVSLQRFRGEQWELCALQFEPTAPGIYLPLLPLDNLSSLGHPRSSFPIASFVYKNKPRVWATCSCWALLWFGEGGVSLWSPVCQRLLDLSDLEAHAAGDRRHPLRGWGWGEEQGHGLWGRRQGGSCSAGRGACLCARLARRLPAQSALLGARGSRGRRAREHEQRPSPGPRLCRRPAVFRAGAHWAGRKTQRLSPPPPLAACPPLSPLSFPCSGAHQWSCLGMHTQLVAGGG